jgi:hypothetical protein
MESRSVMGIQNKLRMKKTALLFLVSVISMLLGCSKDKKEDGNTPVKPPVAETVYDETGLLYTSYTNLVMAGYQGWFAAEGDGSDRGWYHYRNNSCGFAPGCTNVDFWPDITEYTKTYKSPFKFANGSNAYLYSPYDEESVDLHFKWMKDYGIDGVHMQRFVGEIKPSNAAGKRHFNKVLENALKAAKKYDRAISVMYDLSGCTSADVAFLEEDWNELQRIFKLFDNKENPTYLRHNKKPLVTIWGVGFNDNRKYTIADVDRLVDRLKGPSNKVSVMLGVPYYWRTLSNDTENSALLHPLIRKADIIMPWAVGRYHSGNYNTNTLTSDLQWCKNNQVDYVPLIFPGFTWGNMHNDPSLYHSIPREQGDFLWKQVAGAKLEGAKSLYVAMFDEIDEGTAIFKCAREGYVPVNGHLRFVGIENGLESDYYLWLTGQATKWFHGDSSFGVTKPVR